MAEKTCKLCGETKPLDRFHKAPHNKTDGRQARCKPCAHAAGKETNAKWRSKNRERARLTSNAWNAANVDKRRERHLMFNFGITAEIYDAILELQNGCCAICGTLPEESYKGLAVDHDHETGRVRGLLCQRCNMSLGLLGDSIDTLSTAISYLENSRASSVVESVNKAASVLEVA
ncbi:Recombination endonuclease VII [Arthrobacter alpinus]|uniref:Recombination endonuclease VII n=1 Tax=Arthrobacter alpinus TaxID=656366 RepID=A0A1H5M111_9MICC|nr:Recombination endonuclease VII [Arthrobacter alpinus]